MQYKVVVYLYFICNQLIINVLIYFVRIDIFFYDINLLFCHKDFFILNPRYPSHVQASLREWCRIQQLIL